MLTAAEEALQSVKEEYGLDQGKQHWQEFIRIGGSFLFFCNWSR
jgi:hypothetical protein